MRIGFIGLGNMGGPMALNLLKAGHTLVVHDVRRAAAEPHLAGGAKWADTPADAAKDAELVLTSLPGPKEVEAVAIGGENGIIHGIGKCAVYADLSTNSPTLIRRLHATFAEKGIPMIDAPVSGGVPGARNATLAVMVGGDEQIYNRIKPALDGIGDKVSYVGAIGAGAVAKLVHNMIAICSMQILAEAFTMGVKAGVPAEALFTAVQNGAYGQGMLLRALPKVIFKGNFDRVSFALKLARKDLALATQLARENDVGMPLASLVEQDLLAAVTHGLGEKDSSAAFTVQEDRAGVKVRV
ncbi:MAG TPA: NAD(P)-dependent oxidoreductase [Candidatus Binataceae bacterium]|nr:NAD(P)-dependent oxidoreductase [Candidatus Binataceae bacterium]